MVTWLFCKVYTLVTWLVCTVHTLVTWLVCKVYTLVTWLQQGVHFVGQPIRSPHQAAPWKGGICARQLHSFQVDSLKR